ncbi:MAG: hypothetical protein M1828_005969 [Chrysothrix sp. TS-e1954]|nr:MAG: hypothetical protein M1828_005969 [Chrysothrix sp. TS-e1954]
MADPVTVPDEEAPLDDVEMVGASTDPVTGEAEDGEDDDGLPGEEAVEETAPRRITFLDYLRSPIVQLNVGADAEATTLSAHQDLLTKSPWFESACADFDTARDRVIDLTEEDVPAMGSVLEYLYNGECFPRRVGTGRDGTLEHDPTSPIPDNTGATLLKHARIYNLADKFFMPALKSLAHSKIHRTTSTARGEIAYARYVYQSTPKEDTTIRKPVAAFWATRSHVLRHEAEEEFRAMCLEFPQFGFDVLSLVLDQKEKGKGPSVNVPMGGVSMSGTGGGGGGGGDMDATPSGRAGGKGRKRARLSTG